MMAEKGVRRATIVVPEVPNKKRASPKQQEMYGPRRISMAGPSLISSHVSPGAARRSFQITKTYLRGAENHDLASDSRTKTTNQIPEDLEFYGTVSIIYAVETTKDILCLKYTEEYTYIAAGFMDGKIRLFSADKGEFVQTLIDNEIEQSGLPVTSIKHRPVTKNYPIANNLTCTYSNGCVKCWNYNFNQCIYTIREKRETLGLKYHPRLPKFVTFGDDGNIFLYDEETRTQERVLAGSERPGKLDGHTTKIFSACFNPQSNHELVSGGWDNILLFWDLRQPYALRHISNVHICGEGIDINARGTDILTSSWQYEEPLQIWDYATGQLKTSIEPDQYSSKLYCGKFLNKDFLSVGGSDPNIIRFVDLHTHQSAASITGLNGGVFALDIGPIKKKKGEQSKRLRTDVSMLPKMIFCSGKKLFQIDFRE